MSGRKRGLPLRCRGLPRAEVVGAGGEVVRVATVHLCGSTGSKLWLILLKGIFSSYFRPSQLLIEVLEILPAETQMSC